jgi:hypothetical protein
MWHKSDKWYVVWHTTPAVYFHVHNLAVSSIAHIATSPLQTAAVVPSVFHIAENTACRLGARPSTYSFA